jgi:predicted O-linked N-acetylglucosamine transferase (SPINDLY family)
MSLSSGVVAVPGEKMGSRVAASLTAAINCPNTIARNEDDYAEIAVAFGRCALSSG